MEDLSFGFGSCQLFVGQHHYVLAAITIHDAGGRMCPRGTFSPWNHLSVPT